MRNKGRAPAGNWSGTRGAIIAGKYRPEIGKYSRRSHPIVAPQEKINVAGRARARAHAYTQRAGDKLIRHVDVNTESTVCPSSLPPIGRCTTYP
jgi:hypothetical protein